jgi:mRNA-degrading endonuclease RelE of RelBE toxin-antitoxin system
MFTGRFTEKLELELKKLYKKDKIRYEQIMKKIEEILSQDIVGINHYKNLSNTLSDRKRVHIGKNFVFRF